MYQRILLLLVLLLFSSNVHGYDLTLNVAKAIVLDEKSTEKEKMDTLKALLSVDDVNAHIKGRDYDLRKLYILLDSGLEDVKVLEKIGVDMGDGNPVLASSFDSQIEEDAEVEKIEKDNEKLKTDLKLAEELWVEGYKKTKNLRSVEKKALVGSFDISSEEFEDALKRKKVPEIRKGTKTVTTEEGKKFDVVVLEKPDFSDSDRLLVGVGAFVKNGEDADISDGVKNATGASKLFVPNREDFVSESSGVVTYLQIGARKISPYKLVKTTEDDATKIEVEEETSETSKFIEFVYANRWAWNLERVQRAKTNKLEGWNVFHGLSALKEAKVGIGEIFDYDLSFSYDLDSDSEETAVAIVGTSDISMENNIGVHLFRHRFDDGSAYSVGLDLGYAISSDRSAFDAHDQVFFGPSYTANFDAPGGGNRAALIRARIGYSKIESVVYKDPLNSREIEVVNGDIPMYRSESAWAFETDLVYPIGDSALVTLGASIYGGVDPNTWSIQIAYSKPISSILGAFLPSSDVEDSGGEREPTTGK